MSGFVRALPLLWCAVLGGIGLYAIVTDLRAPAPQLTLHDEILYITGPGVQLWRDPVTGCDYFYPEGRPRLEPDGKPMCRATEDESYGETIPKH